MVDRPREVDVRGGEEGIAVGISHAAQTVPASDGSAEEWHLSKEKGRTLPSTPKAFQ
jgi:hypothetical protein